MATVHKPENPAALEGLLRSPSLPLLLALALLAVGLAALLPLTQFSGATTTNADIQRLERQRADLQARIHEMEIEIATLGGLDRIEREARERLRMAPPKETIYLVIEEPGPEPRRLPSRFLPPPAGSDLSGRAWWERLIDWLLP